MKIDPIRAIVYDICMKNIERLGEILHQTNVYGQLCSQQRVAPRVATGQICSYRFYDDYYWYYVESNRFPQPYPGALP